MPAFCIIRKSLNFFFQSVHTPVNRLFSNLQISGNFMSAIFDKGGMVLELYSHQEQYASYYI